MIEYALLLSFPMAMAFAAANDLFTMRIPNKISLALIAGFALAALYLRLPLEAVLTHVGVGAAAQRLDIGDGDEAYARFLRMIG